MNIIYVPISQENKSNREEQKRFISGMIGNGCIHEGIAKLKDSFGNEIEIVVLKLEDKPSFLNGEEKAFLVDVIDKKGSKLVKSLSEGHETKESFNNQKNFLLKMRGKLE